MSLYCYISSPNETKRPRTLSKLNDTTVWERRKTKGKVAIQKMVVDLMELYLHRLKQRRPPYPKSPAVAEFTAKFLFEPTPDQKQVVIKSFLFICFVKDVDLVWGIFSFNLQRLVDVELGNHFFFPLVAYFKTEVSLCHDKNNRSKVFKFTKMDGFCFFPSQITSYHRLSLMWRRI